MIFCRNLYKIFQELLFHSQNLYLDPLNSVFMLFPLIKQIGQGNISFNAAIFEVNVRPATMFRGANAARQEI